MSCLCGTSCHTKEKVTDTRYNIFCYLLIKGTYVWIFGLPTSGPVLGSSGIFCKCGPFGIHMISRSRLHNLGLLLTEAYASFFQIQLPCEGKTHFSSVIELFWQDFPRMVDWNPCETMSQINSSSFKLLDSVLSQQWEYSLSQYHRNGPVVQINLITWLTGFKIWVARGI